MGNYDNFNFSARLKQLRKARGLTQADLAKLLGITSSAVANWETGFRLPEVGTLKTLVEYFGVTMDYLLGYENAQKSEVEAHNESDQLDEETLHFLELWKSLTEEQRKAVLALLRSFGK